MKGVKQKHDGTAEKLISVRIRKSVYDEIVKFAEQNKVHISDVLSNAARNFIETGFANALFPKKNA
jgi:hypothetical protein